jgi:hypothetical protein
MALELRASGRAAYTDVRTLIQYYIMSIVDKMPLDNFETHKYLRTYLVVIKITSSFIRWSPDFKFMDCGLNIRDLTLVSVVGNIYHDVQNWFRSPVSAY